MVYDIHDFTIIITAHTQLLSLHLSVWLSSLLHLRLQDIVITGVLAAGHFAGGVLQAFYGDEWNDYDNSDDGKTIKQSMIASAVSNS